MRKLRLVLLAAALTASTMALPAYASGGPGGGGTGGGGTGGGGGTTISFQTFRMAGALFSSSNPAQLTGAMHYTLHASFLFGFDRNHKTLAANRDHIFLR